MLARLKGHNHYQDSKGCNVYKSSLPARFIHANENAAGRNALGRDPGTFLIVCKRFLETGLMEKAIKSSHLLIGLGVCDFD